MKAGKRSGRCSPSKYATARHAPAEATTEQVRFLRIHYHDDARHGFLITCTTGSANHPLH